MNNIKSHNSIVSKGKILSITTVLFVAIGFIFAQPTFVNAWGYSDYGSTGSSNSYSSPSSSNWGYSDYGSTGSSNSNWGYSDYGSYSNASDWGYSDYGSYSNASDWGYSDYGSYSNASDWGYSDYDDYGCYSSDCYGGYDDFSYGGGYDDYGCYSSDCYGGYDDYSYGNGGYGGGYGGSAGGVLGALGLNLNYSNTETNITDNSVTDNSVNIRNDIDNSTTTTTNTCSNGNNATSSGNCNTTTVNNVIARDDVDIDLDVICIVSDRTIEEGDTVTFEARISGGRPSYRIEWDGDISGDDEKERVRFNRRGTYEVTVEVRDANGDRASDDCEVVVRDEDDDDDDRRITVSTDTNLGTPTGNLSSLESVFLSQVPYTGPGDVAKVLGILALIAVWSTGVALYLKKQRTVKVISNKIANFKEQNKNANKIA